MMTVGPTRPALRYFGGKWRLAPWIIGHFPAHRIYVEPFGGGASVLMRKPRAYGEIYNDLDFRVVNIFRVLQSPRLSKLLERKLRRTPFARDEMELSYRAGRSSVETARRTIIAAFMGFGSDSVTRQCRTGFRSNSNRSGTTPAHDWATWPNQIEMFTDRLRGVVIENRDAQEVMLSQDSKETLHYVDPPYVMDSRSDQRHGYRFEMTDLDHKGLLSFLNELKGMVVLSAYEHEIYSNTLSKQVGQGSIRRFVSCRTAIARKYFGLTRRRFARRHRCICHGRQKHERDQSHLERLAPGRERRAEKHHAPRVPHRVHAR